MVIVALCSPRICFVVRGFGVVVVVVIDIVVVVAQIVISFPGVVVCVCVVGICSLGGEAVRRRLRLLLVFPLLLLVVVVVICIVAIVVVPTARTLLQHQLPDVVGCEAASLFSDLHQASHHVAHLPIQKAVGDKGDRHQLLLWWWMLLVLL